jgi:hypothetical protein
MIHDLTAPVFAGPSYFRSSALYRHTWMRRVISDYPESSPAVLLAYCQLCASGTPEELDTLVDAILDEWPTVAKDDASKLAYTRSPEHGEQGRRTKTTVGKWFARVLPGVFGGRAMDALIAAHGAAAATLEFWDDVEQIIDHMRGARAEGCDFDSCMTSRTLPHACHPYRVYAPELGWRLCIMRVGGDIAGRCLVNGKQYVRCYGTDSSKIKMMKDLLATAGYAGDAGWEGARIRAIWDGADLVGPYIDGTVFYGSVDGDTIDLTNDRYADYRFRKTDGFATENHTGQVELADGGWVDEDDAVFIGGDWYRIEDAVELHNGAYALREDAVALANGEYALHEDAVELVNGDYVLREDAVELANGAYVLREDCVELHDGYYALREDAVELANGEYALLDDAVELVNGDYVLRDDAVQLESGDWHLLENCVQLANGDYALSEFATGFLPPFRPVIDNNHYALAMVTYA